MSKALEAMKARYNELVKKRNDLNAMVGPIKAKIDKVNAAIQEKQAEAEALVKQLNHMRGGADWIDLKKEIALLAKALSGK
jgi:uncharacterized coiled-coil DUF342 family protein